MLTTLIRRELLDNLMTFRFAAAVFITLLLVVTNTAVLIKDYERRLAGYNAAVKMHQRQLQETNTYSAGEVYVDRPPNPLSIFNVGFDKRPGNEVKVAHGYVPSLWDADRHGSDNPFMNIFTSMDLVFIFEVVLSLLALIFAYDALAGEQERGTLRLVLTNPVRRGHILLAKYISAMLCLLVPLLMSLLLAVILLTNSAAISLNTHDFLCIGGIIFASVAYLSVFYLIGMLISAAMRRTSSALMLSMFVWGFLVLVYPNVTLAVIRRLEAPQARMASAFNQIEQIWEEFDRARKDFLATDAFPGEDWGLELRGGGSRHAYLWDTPRTLLYTYESVMDFETLGEEDEPKIPHAQHHFRFLGRLVTDTADRTWLIRKPALEDIFVKPAKVERAWLKLSPIGLYDAATQAWAGTDMLGARDFFDAVRQYRHQVITYLYDKDVFGSREWFSADKGAPELMNLLVISTSSDVHLNAEAWGRLGIIFFIALLYTCLFLALGLLVSARVQRSAVSLVILLLVWVSLVVFMPGTLAAIAGDSASPKATHGFYERSWQLHNELRDQYGSRWRQARGDSRKRIEGDGAYVSKDAEQQEQLQEARLKQQISQVNRARATTRLSPVTIFQHLFESFAGTGFERHLQFLENVKVYAREYREFVVDTDKADIESLHIIGVREGMSEKPVSPEAVPTFEDTLNFSKDFNTAAIDLLLLALFFLVLLSGAYLAFVRVEV